MRRVAVVVGLLLAGIGLLALLYPPVSVWRVSGTALNQLPAEAGEITDARNRFALGDPDFVVATRVYHDRSPDEVRELLLENGFETIGADEASKECCGDWDAMVASWAADDAGGTSVSLTPADGDIQVTWPLFAIVSAVLITVGFGVVSFARRSSPPTPNAESESESKTETAGP